jgi:hypothetical protein
MGLLRRLRGLEALALLVVALAACELSQGSAIVDDADTYDSIGELVAVGMPSWLGGWSRSAAAGLWLSWRSSLRS